MPVHAVPDAGGAVHVVDPALYALRLIIDTFDKLGEPERVPRS